jgi:hypothetical protein
VGVFVDLFFFVLGERGRGAALQGNINSFPVVRLGEEEAQCRSKRHYFVLPFFRFLPNIYIYFVFFLFRVGGQKWVTTILMMIFPAICLI